MEVNKLYFDDCYNPLSDMGDGIVDLFLQDTPFGNTANDWDVIPDFTKMWKQWERVGKDDCVFLFFGTQPFVTDLINSNRKLFRYDLIWEKTCPQGFLNAKKMPLRCHENILIFSKGLHTYNPQKTFGHERKVSKLQQKKSSKKTTNYQDYNLVSYDSTERYPRSVLKYSQDKQKSSLHPTQKPLDLIRTLIKTYSNPDELVFDGYGGGGTTGVASILENRNWIMCENNKGFYDKSANRISECLLTPQLF